MSEFLRGFLAEMFYAAGSICFLAGTIFLIVEKLRG